MAMKSSIASVCLIIAMIAIMSISEVVAHGHESHDHDAPAHAPKPSAAAAFLPTFVVSAFFASAGHFLL